MANLDKKIKASERAIQALELRIKGVPLNQIAAKLGFHDASGARKAINRVLDKTTKESARQLQMVAFSTFQTLMRTYWPRALSGDLQAARFIADLAWKICKLFGVIGMTNPEENPPSKKKPSNPYNIIWEFPQGLQKTPNRTVNQTLDTNP